MTNQQLYILLKGYRDKLEMAIEAAKSLMPEQSERIASIKHTDSGCRSKMSFSGKLLCNNPNHFTEVPDGDFRAIAPLTRMLEEMDEELGLLKSVAGAEV
jgi:hypothetical protein